MDEVDTTPPQLERDPAAQVPPHRANRHRGLRWYSSPLVIIAAVVALGGLLRFYQLSTPREFVFDEVYYAKDGCYLAGIPFEDCQLRQPGEQTLTAHPPLGRWIVAGGVALFSDPEDFHCPPDDEQSTTCDPFGYRAASAAFGTISVLLVALLAYRLFHSALWAGVAGLLLATESLNFVQSRISMVDVFLTTFVLAGFLFLILDREWIQRRTPPRPERTDEDVELGLPPDRPPSPIWRPWRFAAGVAFGSAVAVKWSGGPALLAAIVLAYAWERSRRRAFGSHRPSRLTIAEESFGIFLALALVPIAVYVASYTEWFLRNGVDVSGWAALQQQMASFSLDLRSEHPYASRPWSWLLLLRPVAYYYRCAEMADAGCRASAEILGTGNPVVFWGSLLALPYVLGSWIRRRDWRAGAVFVPFALQYGAWFFAARTSFLFYMTPIAPFLVLAGVYALRDLAEARVGSRRSKALAPLAAFAVAAAVIVFAFFLPVLTGRVIPHSQWQARIWFSNWV